MELPAVVPESSERTVRFDKGTARRHVRLDTSQPVGFAHPEIASVRDGAFMDEERLEGDIS
ncbi:hypothetical protein BJI47_18570 [Rhodococcus sp. 1168]|nr:hypothetical protein BJI47_18570 [Rhodococcus sp. 1168]